MTLRYRLASSLSRSPVHGSLRWLAGQLNRYMDVADNYNNCDFDSNGERFLIQTAAPHWRVALDVGANVGDWTDTVLAASPDCVIHAFEPSPRTFTTLSSKLASNTRVVLHNAGAGSVDGTLSFYDHGAGSVLSSFVDRSASLGVVAEQVIPVPVVTLDAFIHAQGLTHVDFIKVDTEGFELEVLRGLEGSLRARRVGCIQFEYGGTWLDQRVRLSDALAILTRHGYVAHRLLAAGVTRVSPDAAAVDTFKYANFVAVADPGLLDRWGIPR